MRARLKAAIVWAGLRGFCPRWLAGFLLRVLGLVHV